MKPAGSGSAIRQVGAPCGAARRTCGGKSPTAQSDSDFLPQMAHTDEGCAEQGEPCAEQGALDEPCAEQGALDEPCAEQGGAAEHSMAHLMEHSTEQAGCFVLRWRLGLALKALSFRKCRHDTRRDSSP